MIRSRMAEIWKTEGVRGIGARLRYFASHRFGMKRSALNVTHRDAMEWFAYRKHEYDRLIAAVCPYLRSDGIFFDVGANVGYFSSLLTEKMNFRGTVYLFEPVPRLAVLCKKTFRRVPFNAHVINMGLSDRDAEEDLYIDVGGNFGWNTLVSQKATASMSKVRVRLKKFDTCGIGVQPSFIKVDVEGSEYRVFRGMLASLKKWQPLPVILCEVGWGQSHPAWDAEVLVFTEMRQIGYAICDLDGKPIDEKALQETTDVLFLPVT